MPTPLQHCALIAASDEIASVLPSVLVLPSRPSTNRKNIGYLYESQSFGVRDSQLLTLLHEVMDFHDVASSIDYFPGVNSAPRKFANVKAKMNSDGLAAYILAIA